MILPTKEQLVEWFTFILRAKRAEKDDAYEFDLSSIKAGIILTITEEKLEALLDVLRQKQESEQTILFDSRSYEVLVSEEARFRPSIFFRDFNPIEKEDVDNGLMYTLSLPSDEYLLFLISKIVDAGGMQSLRNPVWSSRVRRLLDSEEASEDLLMLVKIILSRSLTLKISSAKNKTLADFTNHSNAFLFQMTYNLDTSFVEMRFLDEFMRSERISRTRRSRIEDIEAPKRLYVQDLVYHYQMAVATDSPLLEYLSYYHIAEHFFEEIYNDDLIENIKNRITLPDFSYRRKKDIRDLIQYINKRQRIRGETVTFSEQEALKLTIQKYVDLADLKVKIDNYDSSLTNYYETTTVSFSDGDTVPLSSSDTMLVFDRLTKRIYKTRNAIVHSKESEKSRYVPFQHDKLLVKEVPLLRFIAEEIVLKTSSLIG